MARPLKIFLIVMVSLMAGRLWTTALWWIFDHLPQGEIGYWIFAVGLAVVITFGATLVLRSTERGK